MSRAVLCIAIVSLSLFSCATIINSSHTTVEIYSRAPSIVIGNDTLHVQNQPVHARVERHKLPLRIVEISDTLSREILVSSKKSFAYYLNFPYTYGLGALVDMKNERRYTYPRRIYFEKDGYKTHKAHERKAGDVFFEIGFPWLNTFLTAPAGAREGSSTGFWFVSGGLVYYHSSHAYWRIHSQMAVDFPVPLPMGGDFDDFESRSGISASVSHHHAINRFSIGYGLNCTRYDWVTNAEAEREHHYGFGLTIQPAVELGRRLIIGPNYRPTFFSRGNMRYEHVISLNVEWRIPIAQK